MSQTIEKFSFDTDFQQEILQFTVTDLKSGFKALELFEPEYFTLTEHAIIAEALRRYYKRKFIVPSQPVLKEELRQLFRLKQWQSLLLKDDKEKVFKIVRKIYIRPVKDADTIYSSCQAFAQMCSLKDILEKVDLNDVASYQRFGGDINKAINRGLNLKEDKGTFILRDAKARAIRRQDTPPGFPTPWWQLNELFNNGGTSDGNIIVILGPAKRFKTGVLLNTARGYLKRGNIVFYADMENGENSLATRIEQAIINKDRKTLLSGDVDKDLLKMIRKYLRFGGELIVKRFPAGSTTTHFKTYMNTTLKDEGLIPNVMICDYPDIMNDSNNSQDEVKRISQVYLDLKNLAEEQSLKCIWCPSHITREGDSRQGKKFKQNDIAKALDKIRHADMILGVNQNEDEKAAGIVRVEVVDQRDGLSDGRVWLFADLNKQRVKEFNKAQVQAREEMIREENNEEEPESQFKKKKVSDI